MLVLARKVGETVKIGENTEVILLSVHEGRVRLGFKAPKDQVIIRKEIEKKLIETEGKDTGDESE